MNIQKIDVSFQQGGTRKPYTDLHKFLEDWIVELQPLGHPDISDLVIVRARSEEEAIYNAFWTRNIASSWKAVSIAKE